MPFRVIILCCAASAALACAEAPMTRPDGGALPGDAGSTADGGPVDETPIVDRPSLATYNCRVERPRADHSPRFWGSAGHSMIATTGGGAFFARLESRPATPFEPAPAHFVVSSIDASGTFGASVELSTGNLGETYAPALARRGDGIALVWNEGGGLNFAALDGAGRVAVPVKTIPGITLDPFSSKPRIAQGSGGGFGVVYVLENAQRVRELWWVGLDAGGERVGLPRRFATTVAETRDPVTAISPAGAGFAVVWRDGPFDRGKIKFAKVDAAGAEVVAAREISTSDADGVDVAATVGFEPAAIAILEIAGGFVAAWPESKLGDTEAGTGAQSLIRIVRLDASGLPRGTPVAVRAGMDGIDEVEPSLVRYADDAVGVLWARGQHIYACGGCVPDHRIDFVLVDPVSLARLSDPVSVDNGGDRTAGGLLRRDVAVLGASVLMTFDLAFHVHSTAGSATFACAR